MNKTRPKQLSFRVSEEEYQQLQEKISESGKNQQEYILKILSKPVIIKKCLYISTLAVQIHPVLNPFLRKVLLPLFS